MATTVDRPAAGQAGAVVEHQLYIGGQWKPARSGQTFEVHNPATGETLARCADGGREEVREAIEAAHQAFPSWRDTPAAQRAQLLSKAAAMMNERVDELARALTQENGKPLSESVAETQIAAAFLQWNAEEARRIYGEVVPTDNPARRVMTGSRAGSTSPTSPPTRGG